MALPVLTPGRRRRRRWPRRLLALLVVAALAGAGSWELRRRGADAPRAAPPDAVAAGPRRGVTLRVSTPAPLVAPGAPLLRHRFVPRLGARAAILVDARTGRILWGRQHHRRLPIASVTKIMTAVLTLERLPPSRVVTIARSVPRAAPIREGLRAGERVAVWKLLTGLLVYSGNDDALALALAVSGSRPAFVALMNRRARELGLAHTHFSTPSGVVDRDNYSTAFDVAALTRYALRNPRFREIVRTRVARVRWSAPTYGKVYVNKNRLLASYRGANGVKTGWTTRARHCLVASARRGRVELIAVVLGSPDAFRDARRLLDLGFARGARAA